MHILEPSGHLRPADYLREIGVQDLPPLTSALDPGHDRAAVESHLQQSGHLMSSLELHLSGWLLAREESTRRKVAAAKQHGVPAVASSSAFEIALAQSRLAPYLDLCAGVGLTRIACGDAFTEFTVAPREIVKLVRQRGLDVQFELARRHGGVLTNYLAGQLIDQGQRWLDAGAAHLVIEARGNVDSGTGVFDEKGQLNATLADRFASALGLETLLFQAPNNASQFALLNHFGRQVHLCNVRLEDLLQVESYRRGLHSEAFTKPMLRILSPPRAATG